MVAGRSALGWLDWLVPKDRSVRQVARDLVYGPKTRHRLDIYAPDMIDRPLPVVLFYYGGGWDSGSKADYGFVGSAFAALGFVTVIADYRTYPDAIYPAFLEDCADAAEWVVRHIADYGGDAEKLVLAGHSAGAYNAVMVAADVRLHGGRLYRSAVRGVIGLSGPYDFFPFDVDVSERSFGGAGAGKESQPINLDLRQAPPMLLAHGTTDETVRLRNIESLTDALKAAGRQVVTRRYAGASHTTTLIALMRFMRWRLRLYNDIGEFMFNLFR